MQTLWMKKMTDFGNITLPTNLLLCPCMCFQTDKKKRQHNSIGSVAEILFLLQIKPKGNRGNQYPEGDT